MVGDSWAADIEGARAAGIRPIWFNRAGRPPPDGVSRRVRGLDAGADGRAHDAPSFHADSPSDLGTDLRCASA